MLSCCLRLILTLLATEIETHQTRQSYFNLLLSNFGVLVDWHPVCSSAAIAHLLQGMLCAQGCSSTNLVVYKWLFELLLPFYRLKPVILLRPLTSTKDCHPQSYCSLDIFSSFNVT